jgi:hypothetical protein
MSGELLSSRLKAVMTTEQDWRRDSDYRHAAGRL